MQVIEPIQGTMYQYSLCVSCVGPHHYDVPTFPEFPVWVQFPA